MYVVKIGEHIANVGDTLTISHTSGSIELEVLEIMAAGFKVKWLNGDRAGSIEYLPFNLFGEDTMTSYEVLEDNEPNRAFRNKKYGF